MTKSNRVMQFMTGVLLLLALLYAPSTFAQQSGQQGPATDQSTPGVKVDSARKTNDLTNWDLNEEVPMTNAGGYEIKQAAEFGGRISDFTGSQAMWDTLVNLGSGPRLLEYSLQMHSPDHHGLLFDDLSFDNFGYGGDPNDVSRFNVMKGKIYNFNATFRRDQNIFDYDLLANPLNPSTSVPNIPVVESPHEFLLVRRMSDANLNLFPLSKVRLRFGWSRVVNEGTSFSSIHVGTEPLLNQPTLNTTDTYQGGISLQFIPRTSINYDQFYTFYKGDTTAGLNSLPFTLAGGIPVNLGLVFNTAAGQPCAQPILTTGLANPACNGYLGYSRSGRNRNSFPTEQLTFQSNYFHRLDMSGRINYSDAEASSPDLLELFNGLSTRDRLRASIEAGSALTKRLSLTGDFAATYRVTEKLRLVDDFRYDNFRIPGSWGLNTASLFGTSMIVTPNVFSPATCPPPFTAATCPQHSTSSGPDVVQDALNQFLGQEQKINTFEIEYDLTKRVNVHLGYRYENREITSNVTDVQVQTFFPAVAQRGACATLTPDPTTGVCTATVLDAESDFVPINAHSLLFGFSARPTDQFRMSFDTEQYYADNTFTRISPRHLQVYKIRGHYQPNESVSLGAAINIHENRNDTADINNLQHNRTYAFTAAVAPAEAKWGADVSYDYNDIFSATNICFVSTPAPVGSLACAASGTTVLSGISTYTSLSHFGSVSVYLKPVRRLTAGAGYTITSSTGNTLILNPIAPTGPLNYNYHLPMANLAFTISKHLVYKAGWNYYDYNEKSDPGPTAPRDFRGNTFTLSLRYAM